MYIPKEKEAQAMKEIKTLEENIGRRYSDIGVTPAFGEAYYYSREAGNELINFGEVIWERDIETIIEDCKRFGLNEFTISSTFSSLLITVQRFLDLGCELCGMVTVNSRFDDWKLQLEGKTGKERIPALKIRIK